MSDKDPRINVYRGAADVVYITRSDQPPHNALAALPLAAWRELLLYLRAPGGLGFPPGLGHYELIWDGVNPATAAIRFDTYWGHRCPISLPAWETFVQNVASGVYDSMGAIPTLPNHV